MKALFKVMEVIGVNGFMFTLCASGETLKTTIILFGFEIAFLLIAIVGYKGVENEEDIKVHDCTSHRANDASYPSFLRK